MVALAWMSSACHSSSKVEEAPRPRVDWGTDEIESISRGVVDDLLDLPGVSGLAGTARGDDLRVPAYMAGIANETKVPIAAEALVAAMERLLIGSGRFRFVSDEESEEPSEGATRRTPKVTDERAREAGHELGADVAIYAVFRALDGDAGSPADPGYVLILNCVQTQGEESAWSTKREVSRTGQDLFRVR